MFKAFCRFVCPLGAALALAGKVRRLDWITRRTECGSPCQFCRARCEYGAIEPTGKIDYDECFQCLDCVTIIEDPKLCIPERLASKKGHTVVLGRR
jgi:polyferredoxin